MSSSGLSSGLITEVILQPEAQLRLICFPWAGGTGHAYHEWRDGFPTSSIELLAIALPGRGMRATDPAYTGLGALVDDVVDALLPFLSAPFAFFGHSFGAILAFEVARALELRALPAPLSVFISAHPAPSLPLPKGQMSLSSSTDDALVDGLKQWDFVLDAQLELASDASLRELILRSIRTDLSMREAYCSSLEASDPLPLSTPLHVFVGADDASLDQSALSKWSAYTSAEFSITSLPGGHFYLSGATAKLLVEHICELSLGALRRRPLSVLAAEPLALPEWYCHEQVGCKPFSYHSTAHPPVPKLSLLARARPHPNRLALHDAWWRAGGGVGGAHARRLSDH